MIWLESIIDEVFRARVGVFYADWMFWVGIVGVLLQFIAPKQFKLNYGKKMDGNHMEVIKWMEVVSFDLIALSLVQCHANVGISIFLVLLVLYNTYWTYDTIQKGKQVDKFKATDIYLDFRLPILKVCTVFTGQCLLFALYLSVLFDSSEADGRYLYWLYGIAAIQMVAMFGRGVDSQLGEAFQGKLYTQLWTRRSNLILTNEDDGTILRPNPSSIVSRSVMAFIVNAVMRDVIAYTTPLVLMVNVGDSLDFIQNGLAVVFVVALDATACGGTYSFAGLGSMSASLVSSGTCALCGGC